MIQIGYANTDLTKWGPYFPSGPVEVFIPEPGTRENINAEAYQHIGWIVPDRSGTIHATHADGGADSRPAYIQRGFDDKPSPVLATGSTELRPDLATRLKMRGIHDTADVTPPVTREEFEALVLRVDTIAHMLKPPAPTIQAEPAMTFYDLDNAVHALHAAVSTRPNVTLPNRIDVDRYFEFVGNVERAANTVRDEIEQLRRNRLRL